MGLGLGGGFAFKSASIYIIIPTVIAGIISLFFNKFKFNKSSFYKFWFWIMLITLISYAANSLAN